MEGDNCPLCGNALKTTQGLADRHRVVERDCPACGRFVMDDHEVATRPWAEADGFKIAAFIRRQNLLGRTPAFTRDWQQLKAAPPEGTVPVTFADAMADFPRTVGERLDRALLNLAQRSNKPGADVDTTPLDYPLFYAEDFDVMRFFTDQLCQSRLVHKTDHTSSSVLLRLTVEGWNRVADLQRAGLREQSDQAFVAMWFRSQTEAAYCQGIGPAIEECGYRPYKANLAEHVNKICDEVIKQIRASRFVVADFTGDRHNVYFEAGYARGWGSRWSGLAGRMKS
jgi:hypothetical protein